MPSIVTSILSSTVGFLCGKARDSAAEKLKDGGLADEQLREIIVQDLTDIRSKLDCLSLKDLDSSYTFLKEGVGLLNLALDTSIEDQRVSKDEATSTKVADDSTSGILSAAVSALSLPEAIQRLKSSSKERFVSAKDRFKASRERATDAFNNKSLKIKDRIMACKLRVAAGILETGLEDPVAATTSCLLTLAELHDLPAVQEIFSVFLNGGWKSRFSKAERLENIMSVLFINHALFEFAAKYSSKYPNVFTWPGIQLIDQQFNPIVNGPETLISRGDSVLQINRVAKIRSTFAFAVNSRCEIIGLCYNRFEVTNPSTGECKHITLPDSKGILTEGIAIAADGDDNVYVIVRSKSDDVGSAGNKLYNHLLCVYDRNHDLKHQSVLDIFDKDKTIKVHIGIAVDKNKNIVMVNSGDRNVYILDNTGRLKCKFRRDGKKLLGVSISSTNDIIISSQDCRFVNIYTTEGKLKSILNVPEDHQVCQATYHHGIGKIIVFTRYSKAEKLKPLLCYSDAGKLEHTVDLRPERFTTRLISHPSGPFAIKWDDAVILI